MPRKLTLEDIEQAPPGSVAVGGPYCYVAAGFVRGRTSWSALWNGGSDAHLVEFDDYADVVPFALCDALILPNGRVIGRQS